MFTLGVHNPGSIFYYYIFLFSEFKTTVYKIPAYLCVMALLDHFVISFHGWRLSRSPEARIVFIHFYVVYSIFLLFI